LLFLTILREIAGYPNIWLTSNGNKMNIMNKSLFTLNITPLVNKINTELKNLELSVKRQTVQTYWRVGKWIARDILKNKNRAGYGNYLLEQLAQKSFLSKRSLERTVQFYRQYPIATSMTQLTWTHFVQLITVKDPKFRQVLEKKAVKQHWSVRKLQKEIKNISISSSVDIKSKDIPVLAVTRGEVGVYPLIKDETLPKGRQLVIDYGFKVRDALSVVQAKHFKAGDVVRVTEKNKQRHLEKVDVPKKQFFTYKAYLKRVTDGDTIVAHLDVGFGEFLEQRLRLRGLDAPEIKTSQGQKAGHFIERRLKKQVVFIIQTTKKIDKYGRYVADVFYSVEGRKGEEKFLNQELLNSGLVRAF